MRQLAAILYKKKAQHFLVAIVLVAQYPDPRAATFLQITGNDGVVITTQGANLHGAGTQIHHSTPVLAAIVLQNPAFTLTVIYLAFNQHISLARYLQIGAEKIKIINAATPAEFLLAGQREIQPSQG